MIKKSIDQTVWPEGDLYVVYKSIKLLMSMCDHVPDNDLENKYIGPMWKLCDPDRTQTPDILKAAAISALGVFTTNITYGTDASAHEIFTRMLFYLKLKLMFWH